MSTQKSIPGWGGPAEVILGTRAIAASSLASQPLSQAYSAGTGLARPGSGFPHSNVLCICEQFPQEITG